MPNDPGADGWDLHNEFAAVRIRVDTSANSARLEITDLRSGRRGYLDPLELERIASVSHADLAGVMSPAAGEAQEDLARI